MEVGDFKLHTVSVVSSNYEPAWKHKKRINCESCHHLVKMADM